MRNKKFKKTLCMTALSLAVLCAAVVPGGTYVKAEENSLQNADGEEEYQWEEESQTWILDAYGTLTVSGTGNMSAYYWDDFDEKQNDVKKIVLNVTGADRLSINGYDFPNVESIDLRGFDASQVTTMAGAFAGLKKLKTIEFGSFDTRNVTDMCAMFDTCSSLTSLNLSGWNTGKVTDMSFMFSDCISLSSLNLSGFDTSAVTNMRKMFYACNRLQNLNISHFNTAKVADMYGMFSGCVSLQSLDLRGWNTENAADMSYLFDGCKGLVNISLGGWNTEKTMNMCSMFYDCSSLTALDLTGFRTGNVTDMDFMFSGCNNIKELDISNFDLTGIELNRDYTGETYAIWLFGRLDNLEKVRMPANLPERVNTPYSVIVPDNMREYWTDASGAECEYFGQGLSVPVTYTRVWKEETVIQQPIQQPDNNGSVTNPVAAKPKAASISKLKAGSKKITVAWKRQSSISGYQVQISKNKKFKTGTIQRTFKPAKTKATVKKLRSNTKYFVRIRTYRTEGGKTYYSGWSKAKKIKTKK